jgi:hypothetical protein
MSSEGVLECAALFSGGRAAAASVGTGGDGGEGSAHDSSAHDSSAHDSSAHDNSSFNGGSFNGGSFVSQDQLALQYLLLCPPSMPVTMAKAHVFKVSGFKAVDSKHTPRTTNLPARLAIQYPPSTHPPPPQLLYIGLREEPHWDLRDRVSHATTVAELQSAAHEMGERWRAAGQQQYCHASDQVLDQAGMGGGKSRTERGGVKSRTERGAAGVDEDEPREDDPTEGESVNVAASRVGHLRGVVGVHTWYGRHQKATAAKAKAAKGATQAAHHSGGGGQASSIAAPGGAEDELVAGAASSIFGAAAGADY